jgi:hypothetical protein
VLGLVKVDAGEAARVFGVEAVAEALGRRIGRVRLGGVDVDEHGPVAVVIDPAHHLFERNRAVDVPSLRDHLVDEGLKALSHALAGAGVDIRAE